MPCHCTFSVNKLEVFRLGLGGTLAQHPEGELSLVEWPQTRATLEANLEVRLPGLGGVMRLKRAEVPPAPVPTAPVPTAPVPAPSRRVLHPFCSASSLHSPAAVAAAAAVEAVPAATPPAAVAATPPPATPVEDDSPYRSRSPRPMTYAAPSAPVTYAPPAPVNYAPSAPAMMFEATIINDGNGYWFARDVTGRFYGGRDILLGGSDFQLQFSLNIRPCVGTRVRGTIHPSGRANKALSWWIA